MTTYTSMTAAVTAAIKGELTTVNKWQTAGQTVRDFYGTETAINEVKAQFIADAIIPALDRKHAAALDKELSRKGSAEFNALDDAGKQAWETSNQAKKDARAIAHTMFTRVVRYAFPAEKKERVPTALKTRLQNELASLIKACEKSEGEDFDVAGTINNLRATLAFVNK
jgi:hypothetical protein